MPKHEHKCSYYECDARWREEVKEECDYCSNHNKQVFCNCICHSPKQKEEENCCSYSYRIGTVPCICDCHFPKQKEEGQCCKVHPDFFPDECCGGKKQDIDLSEIEEITMREVGEYAAKTECGITEALVYILWMRVNKFIRSHNNR